MSATDIKDLYLAVGFGFFCVTLIIGQWKAHALVRRGGTWDDVFDHIGEWTFRAAGWLIAWPVLAWILASRAARRFVSEGARDE